MECPICKTEYKSYKSVSIHFRNKHGTSLEFKEIMRLKLVSEKYNGIEPKCKCGCGETPKYRDYLRGYTTYVKKHHLRITNNWGHNKKAQLKSQNTRRQMYKSGQVVVWNKGKTKKSDERVAAYGQTQSMNITEENKLIRSKRMKAHRLSGVVPTLSGSQHSQWKGGTTSLHPLARSRLFSIWTYPKLKASLFKCQKCNTTKHLEVHHDKERFATILQKAIVLFGEVSNNDFDKKSTISEWIANYHIENDVSGVVLCSLCHDKEHLSN